MDKVLASFVDHTLLKADASPQQITKLCAEAKEHYFASVCVPSYYVRQAARELRGSEVKVCTVVGFPLGNQSSVAKAFEASWAVEQGAEEIDMVINLGLAKSGDFAGVEDDIAKVVKAVKSRHSSAIVKAIIETCYLSDQEKEQACIAAKSAGADYVKTSTGFGTAGATIADVELMRRAVGPDMGVKASGGIRTKEQALEYIAAGATRLGTSSGVIIIS